MWKTRSTAAVDCCTTLSERERRRTGPYSMSVAAVNEKSVPGVMWPWMTWEPPYHSAAIIPSAAAISMSGSVTSSARTFLSESATSRSLSASKRACSWRSRPNAFTILVPLKDSWRSTASWAMRSWVRLLIL